MKRIIFIITVVLISTSVYSQCNDELVGVCYPKVGEYSFLKSYPVRIKKTKKKQTPTTIRKPVFLKGGNKYRIVACNASEYEGKIVVSLYNIREFLTSTHDSNTGKHFPKLEFTCKRSEMYYLNFYFENGDDGCAVVLLSQEVK